MVPHKSDPAADTPSHQTLESLIDMKQTPNAHCQSDSPLEISTQTRFATPAVDAPRAQLKFAEIQNMIPTVSLISMGQEQHLDASRNSSECVFSR